MTREEGGRSGQGGQELREGGLASLSQAWEPERTCSGKLPCTAVMGASQSARVSLQWNVRVQSAASVTAGDICELLTARVAGSAGGVKLIFLMLTQRIKGQWLCPIPLPNPTPHQNTSPLFPSSGDLGLARDRRLGRLSSREDVSSLTSSVTGGFLTCLSLLAHL